MARIVGVAVTFGNEERNEKLIKAAKDNGFQIIFFDYNNIKQEELDSCEILFGMVNRELIYNAKNLKWIHASFAGVDKYIDIPNINNGDIILTNSSGAYGITISEHMITVLLMLYRRMTDYYELQKSCKWDMLGDIKSIMNSTITIIGMGDIGQNFAKRVKAMGATVRGVRRNSSLTLNFVDEMYSKDNILEAIKEADVVALCLPETEETKQIIGQKEIDSMKKEAVVINVGRGSAIDQNALIMALNNDKIGGAALDVVIPEPLPKDHQLWSTKNLIITPHISGNMALPLTCDIVIDLFCKNLKRYARNEKLENIIDCKKGY